MLCRKADQIEEEKKKCQEAQDCIYLLSAFGVHRKLFDCYLISNTQEYYTIEELLLAKQKSQPNTFMHKTVLKRNWLRLYNLSTTQ